MTNPSGSNQIGAPLGNRSNLRHGLRAGRLPPGCGSIRRSIDQLRMQLENAVLAVRGEVTVVDAATIGTALKWQTHSALCQRWLRLNFDFLNHSERLAYSKETAQASANRDKAIRDLNIVVNPADLDPAALMRARMAQNRPQRIERASQVPEVIPASREPQSLPVDSEGDTHDA